MTSKAELRRGVVRFVVLALLAATLAVVASTGPAAAENPPSYITKWGSTGSGQGDLYHPFDVAVDPSTGDVYVADTDNNRIQKFTSTGTYLASWGGPSGGSGDGEFHGPYGIAVDPSTGDVYVADAGNNRIQKFDSSGTFITKWGTFGTGDSQFNNPMGVAVDPSTGDVYVPDYGNQRIQKFDSSGTFITKWGSGGVGDGQFGSPRGAAVDPSTGDVYVTDYTARVQKFTSTGDFIMSWGSFGDGEGQFETTWHVAVDPFTGDVYVTDDQFARIQKFTSTGTYLTQWGSPGSQDGQFGGAVHGVAVDPNTGDVYVPDQGNNRIQRFGDVTDPTVDLRNPPDGAIYARNQVVTADYSCADEAGGSGIATTNGCIGTAADGSPINTATYGSHDFTVTATDRAANTADDTHSYTVATPRPDGRIKLGSGTFVGNDIYNRTGLNQTRSVSAPRGSSVTYTVKAQNDSLAPDTLRLRGTGSNTAFAVTYTVGGVNATAAMVAGGYTTPTLAPGATVTIKVVVKVRASAPAGSSLTGTVTAKSNTDPTIKDTVKFVTRRA